MLSPVVPNAMRKAIIGKYKRWIGRSELEYPTSICPLETQYCQRLPPRVLHLPTTLNKSFSSASMAKQIIFITGGSGYIGGTVIEAAIRDGYAVTALSRSEASDAKITKLGASPVRGDLMSTDVLTREAAKADIVINIADSIAGEFGKITVGERFKINNGAIDAIVEGMKGSGKPLVLTSGSLYTAPDPEGKETDETSPGQPDNHPFKTDFEPRNLAYVKDNIRVMFVRLAPYVFGRGGSGVKLLMERFAEGGAGVYIEEGKAHITTVDVEDAARLFLLIAKKGRAGEMYNATWETHVTQRQLAEAICKQIDVPCHALPFEAACGQMGEWFATFLASENRASNKKAREELGWEIRAEKGILEDIASGSYVAVAETLKAKKTAA